MRWPAPQSDISCHVSLHSSIVSAKADSSFERVANSSSISSSDFFCNFVRTLVVAIAIQFRLEFYSILMKS
ncbi:hypothetical protein AAC387_Pa08g2098 [Persea americana]